MRIAVIAVKSQDGDEYSAAVSRGTELTRQGRVDAWRVILDRTKETLSQSANLDTIEGI